MKAHVGRMRQDWHLRACDDPVFWVYMPYGRGNRDLGRVFAEGARQAIDLLAPTLQRLQFDPSGKRVLEIGCGIGRFFPGFEKLGFAETWGSDVSPGSDGHLP